MKTLIKDIRIVDGKGAVIPRGSVLFDESGILEVLDGGNLALEAAGNPDRVMDGTGKTLIPGLIDSHVHLGTSGLDMDPGEIVMGAAIVSQLEEFPKYGITTVRSMSTKHDSDIKVRDMIDSGYLKGPRVIACGRGISITGGHGWQNNYECDTPDKVKKAARQIMRNGADFIKLFATGGMGTKGSVPNAPQLSEEQMRVATEEAENRGLFTAAHCTGIEGAKRAIRAGVRSIEHVQLDEETAQLMAEHGSYYCPTIITRYNIIHSTEPQYEHMRKKASPQDLERKKLALELCKKYQVPVCASTDSMGAVWESGLTPVGISLIKEMKIYREFGMTEDDILRSATSVAAEMMRIDDVTGSIEPGKCADLVILEKNPLENIEALNTVCMTFARGEILYEK